MNDGRTGVRRRTSLSWLLVLGVLAAIAWAALWVVRDITTPRVSLTINKSSLRADLAQTDAARQRGLSGRKELAATRAMLFVFAHDERWGIWMKEMRFAIDIVWLDANKKVVDLRTNVQPDAEPHEVYRPQRPARYVVEVAAGTAQRLGVRPGQQVQFELGRTS